MHLTGNPYFEPSDNPQSGIGGTQKIVVAAGQASGVDITVTGIKPHDVVQALLEVVATTADVKDRTADVSLIKTGAIQISGASASGNKLITVWLDKNL
jgi:hypothetical protein